MPVDAMLTPLRHYGCLDIFIDLDAEPPRYIVYAYIDADADRCMLMPRP